MSENPFTQVATPAQGPRPSTPAVAISNQMVRLLARYVGRGPTRARTTLNTNLCVVTFGDTMTRAEQNLVAVGQADAVMAMRRVFQATMREEAVRTVEMILERKVMAYMADIDTDANVGMVAFVLEPRAESNLVEIAEAIN